MEEVVIKAVKREVIGKQVKALRREGKLPAILYGHGLEPTPVLLDLHDASRSLNRAGASTLVNIELEGQNHKAVIRERQRDVVRGTLKHVDFQLVSMTEKLRVSVNIELVGESAAVEDLDGVLVSGMETVEVEAFPGDLPESIRIDISRLKSIGDAIYVRDLSLPGEIEILEDPEEMVVLVTAPAAEVEEEVVVEEVEPEVIERGKREEEEEES